MKSLENSLAFPVSRCLATLLACIIVASPEARELFVAPDGRDTNPGSREAPFASLPAARDAIRGMREEGTFPPDGITICLREGMYSLEEPLVLGPGDGGDATAPVVYRAAPGERVILTGGRTVTGFEPVTNPKVLSRLDPDSRGKVLRADLRAQGIEDYGSLEEQGSLAQTEPDDPWPAMELSFDGRIMHLARWPNEGFARVDQLWPPSRGTVVRNSDLEPGERMAYRYSGDRPSRWVDEPDPWTHGYHGNDWDDWYSRITAVSPATRTITLSDHYSSSGPGIERNHRWYGLNLFSELDAPGEYYIDRKEGMLYFLPPGPVNQGTATVSIAPQLIVLRGASHLAIRGFTLEGCRGNAVSIFGGENVSAIGCTIRNTGRMGVYVKGGKHHRVAGCDIYDVGDTAVYICDAGDRKTLTRADHYVENNHIYRPGRIVRCHRVAVTQSGVGIYSRNNTIHDCPGQGIITTGNDLLIEFNEFANCTFENRDSANIVGTHTVIRWNFLHHLFAGSSFTRMIYMDVFTSDDFIFGNVFYACYGGQAVHIGGARYNTIENNVFVDCHPALWIDNRTGGIWGENLEQYDYTNPPWSVRYPRFAYMDEEKPWWGPPLHTRVVRNVCWGPWDDQVDAPSREVSEWWDNLVVDADPGFINAEEMDFRLTDEAAARLRRKIGFIPIPFDRIGCVTSEERASWPVPRHIRPDRPRMHIVEVPYRREGVTLDGGLAEWADIPRCPIQHDMSGGFLRLLWSGDGLYGCVEAKDGTPNSSPDLPWMGDCVMLYVEPDNARRKNLEDGCIAVSLSARPDLATDEAQISEWDWTDNTGGYATLRSLGRSPKGIRCSWSPTDEGYRLEFAVPASALGMRPLEEGNQMGFYAALLDDGAPVESFYAPEFPPTEAPFTWGRIRLERE